jgi:hypothetical protein
MSIIQNLVNGNYTNRKPYVPHEVDAYAANEYDYEEDRIKDEFKSDLLEQYNMNNEKGEKVFWAAYRDGHDHGYESVYEKFMEYKHLSDKEIEDLQ